MISVFICHLPLDAHPQVGNNAILADKFVEFFHIKNAKRKKFGSYRNQPIGFGLRLKNKIAFADLRKFCKAINIQDSIYNFGNKKDILSVAFISGGALSEVAQAHAEKYDVLVTGE